MGLWGCTFNPVPPVLHRPLRAPRTHHLKQPGLCSSPFGITCAAKNAKGVFLCSACKPYAPRVTTGYDDRAGNTVKEPFCDGVCMHYKLYGTLLESVRGACVLFQKFHLERLPYHLATQQCEVLQQVPVLHVYHRQHAYDGSSLPSLCRRTNRRRAWDVRTRAGAPPASPGRSRRLTRMR